MPTEMKCTDCSFWGKADGSDLDGIGTDQQLVGVRRCTKAMELWEATMWNEDYDRVLKPGVEDQKMFVTDGSSYAASLYTKPDFFCAHYTV